MARKVKHWVEGFSKLLEDAETHPQYIFWAGMSAVSSVMKNKIHFNRGTIKMCANQYIVLVGPPGCGKGVAITAATDLVKESNLAHFLSDRMTAEGIFDTLKVGFTTQIATANGFMPAIEAAATIISTELQTLLGGSDWMLPFLCDMWDKNRYEFTSRSKGNHVAKNLCTGIIAGCTPEFIRKINKDAISGGYTARNMFIYAGGKAPANAWPKDMNKGLRQNLIDDLKAIAMVKGEIKFDSEAMKLFTDFYDDTYNSRDEFENEVIQNFKSRMWAHAVKAAMVLAISQGDKLIINKEQLQESIDETRKVLKSLDITFRGVGDSPLATALDRIMRFIELKGSTSRSEIMKYNSRHITDEDLDRVLKVLVQTQFCRESVSGSKILYDHNKPAVITGVKFKTAGVP